MAAGSNRMLLGWRGLAAFALLFMVSCDECPLDPPPPPPTLPCEVGPMVTVSVSPGLVPTFSWTPNCLIGRLIVEAGPGEEYWGTETVGLNIYHTPIVYGVHPPGSVEMQVPQPLDTLTVFRVNLYRWTSSHPDSLDAGGHLVGTVQFSPRPAPSDSVFKLDWVKTRHRATASAMKASDANDAH